MVSRIKKMLSKVCIFGLAASMSFGFGSFLASAAAPNESDPGYAVIGGSDTAINIDGGVYVSNVVGNSLTWNNTEQLLINTTSMPLIMYKPTSNNPAINITNVDELNIGNIWLRAKNATGSGDSGWVKVWSDQGASAGFIEGALAAVKVSAPGSYSFYYYVDSDTGFETNGFYNGTEYDTSSGTGTVPSGAPTDNS